MGEWYVALCFGEARPVRFKVLERASGGWVKVEHRDEVARLNTNAGPAAGYVRRPAENRPP